MCDIFFQYWVDQFILPCLVMFLLCLMYATDIFVMYTGHCLFQQLWVWANYRNERPGQTVWAFVKHSWSSDLASHWSRECLFVKGIHSLPLYLLEWVMCEIIFCSSVATGYCRVVFPLTVVACGIHVAVTCFTVLCCWHVLLPFIYNTIVWGVLLL